MIRENQIYYYSLSIYCKKFYVLIKLSNLSMTKVKYQTQFGFYQYQNSFCFCCFESFKCLEIVNVMILYFFLFNTGQLKIHFISMFNSGHFRSKQNRTNSNLALTSATTCFQLFKQSKTWKGLYFIKLPYISIWVIFHKQS